MKNLLVLLKKFLKWLLSLFARRKRPEPRDENEEEEESDNNSNSNSNSRPQSNPALDLSEAKVQIKDDPKVEKSLRPIHKEIKYDKHNHIIVENFDSINALIHCLETRKNNFVMRNTNNSSTIGNNFFTGTSDYSSAVYLLREGYAKVLPEIKSDYRKQVKILSQKYVNIKSKNVDTVYGGCPNVPRALMCLPKDLQNREIVPRKLKTICIVYACTVSATIPSWEFIKCGKVLLAAIELLELSGMQLKLINCFYAGYTTHHGRVEQVLGSVLLKDYSDRLNILKLCFPLAHPAMLRRIGFKFLETVPGITLTPFSECYGVLIDKDVLESICDSVYKNQNVIVIGTKDIINMKYKIETLIKYIEDNAKK